MPPRCAREGLIYIYYAHAAQFVAWCVEVGGEPAHATKDDLGAFRKRPN